ncbi:EF-hand domain-containing protein D1 isoform X1 [Acanthochromis polyacanthus]|uniref:EF-hand domain-containing protein D1 isoform X1 n=1 Tax=Acanthochromis polyacanthus TaxID=80966 RepID=UPI002233EC49|nr:EF-hand domain-containing protein D1 isoform X1 [Acanthochromis polyacanthus]
MPKQVLTDRHLYNVNMSEIRCGFLKTQVSSPGRRQWWLPLATQLECLSAEVNQALIIISPEVIAVFRDQSRRYGVFDSHSRDSRGLPSHSGKAIVMTFAELSDLANHLHTLFRDRGDSASYEFVPVSFQTDSPSEHPQQSPETEVQDEVSEPALLALQADSGTAVKIEEDIKGSSAVPQAVKLSKLDKDRRRKAKRRACDKKELKEKLGKKTGERIRYASCAEFRRQKIQAHSKCVQKNREQRLLSSKKYYAKFNVKMRDSVKNKYMTDYAFRSRKQNYVVKRYRMDPAFQNRQKKYLVKRYSTDPAFRNRQKNYVVKRYSTDPAFQNRQKKYVVKRYSTDPAFRNRQKKYVVQRYRKDPEFRLHHNQRCSLLRRRRLAANPDMRQKLQRALSIRRKYRQLGTSCQPVLTSVMAVAIAAFRETISHGPTYVCTVCHRTMFPNQVKSCKRVKYSTNIDVAQACLTGTYVHVCDAECSSPCSMPPERLQEWICHNCDSHLSRGRMPTHAVANNLELAPIPPELAQLNVLERQLIAKILPFAKIIALPKGQQRAVHGAVVCVPSEVESVVNSLPRPLPEAQLLQVKLKRHIRFKGYQHFYTVNMMNVLVALEKLREQHSEYSDVTIDEEATFQNLLHDSDNECTDDAQWGEDGMLDKELLEAADSYTEPVLADFVSAAGTSRPEDDQTRNTDMPSPSTELENRSNDVTTETLLEESADDIDSQHDSMDAAQWGEDILDQELLQVSDSYQTNLAADIPTEQQEELRPGLALDTCMQPPDIAQEILSYGDGIFSVAPAQGNKPVGFFAIPKLEAMAFPVQFPTGENTLDEDRPIKLSPSRYFNARLFGADTRFAEDQTYLFFAQFVTETNLARGSMSIQMRKGKMRTKDGRAIKNSMLQDKEEVERLIQAKEAMRFMQPLRGTPAYWNKSLRDLHAMLRQLGKPTFFLTFSAAEMRWPEIIGVIKSQQGQTLGDFSELDWKAKCDILRSNPVTVMRMFEKRVDALMAKLILSPARPIGEVEDYFYRVEFQARGSPHIHMLVWVKDAPVYGEDLDHTVCRFIDRHISCQMPDPEKDPELHKIVSEVQVHSRSHTGSCRKGNVVCRYGFPKLPFDITWITEPFAADVETEDGQDQEEVMKQRREQIRRQQRDAKEKLRHLRELLMDPKASFESLSDLLRRCDLEHDAYMKCAENLTSGSVVMLKRQPKECWVNAYNPDLLRAWNANMDIQYVLDEYCCAMYMMSYITKPEHEMTEFLNSVVKTSRESAFNQCEEMRKIMQAYAKHREVSAQEAVARTCSLPLKKCSRSVIFLSTDEEAMKMSLPMSRLKDMAPDSEEVWMLGVPEKYLFRPKTPEFQGMCLAEFASDYRVVYGEQAQGPSAIALLCDKGHIAKRTAGKPAVIRYARFSETKAPEKHFRRLLKLYLPHRSDDELNDGGRTSYEEFYKSRHDVKDIVEHNRKRFEGRGAGMDKALQNVQFGPVLNAWNTFAPEVEAERQECLELREKIPEEQDEDAVPDFEDLNVGEPLPRIEAPRLSPDFVRKMFQSLNETQACVFYAVRQWCLRRVWGQDPEPFHYFVSGGAGCGKSHVIKCIHEEATRILRQLPRFRDAADMSQPTVLLTAFTGTAAFNIAGKTLHSVLKLPRSLEPPYQGLGNALDELRATLSSVEILIIDEISMVSKKLFAYVNWRFQQLKGNRRPFGGISVLAVGDFYQLPPLGRAKPLCVYEETEFDLWRERFTMVNLTEIMRQKDDRAFAELLNRLRIKRKQDPLCAADRGLLMRAVSDGKDCPPGTLHVFATNKQVDSHNAATVASLLKGDVKIAAEDYRKDVATGRKVPVPNIKGTKRDLPDSIMAAEGARVMLIRNLNVEDGLVNGTFGTISTILPDRRDPKVVSFLGLKLDNTTAGQTLRKKLLGPSDDLVYVERSEESIGRKGGVVRRQFPVKLAFACTAHKVQGMTVTSAVVSLKRMFQPGMAYVALSRTTSLQGLTITDFDETKIYADPAITTALEDMRSASFQSVTPLLHRFNRTERPDAEVTIVHHNTQGLPSHMVDLKLHHELRLADVLCLTETHLSGSSVSSSFDLEGYTVFHRSRQACYTTCRDMASKAGGGVAVYCRSALMAEAPSCMGRVTDLECLVVKVEVPVKVLIATVYRPPDFGLQKFLPNLNALLDTLELLDHHPIVVCGDFNEDLLSRGKKSIRDALLSRGYNQLITESTTDKNTVIDHIYISQPEKCVQSGVLQTYYSYHSPVYCILTG